MSYTYKGEQFPSVTTINGQLDKSGALIPWSLNCYESKILDIMDRMHYNARGQYELATCAFNMLLKQAKKEYKEVSKDAIDIGTQVHDAIEQYIKTGQDLRGELKPEVENGFIAFLEWEADNVDKWLESEIKLVNYEDGYAGTYDGTFIHKKGYTVLVDFKTSKAIYDEYWLQNAAYREARNKLEGEHTIIFERGKGGTFTYNLDNIHIDKVAVLRLDKETGMPEYKERKENRMHNDYMAFKSLVDHYYYAKKRRLKNNHIVKEIWG